MLCTTVERGGHNAQSLSRGNCSISFSKTQPSLKHLPNRLPRLASGRVSELLAKLPAKAAKCRGHGWPLSCTSLMETSDTPPSPPFTLGSHSTSWGLGSLPPSNKNNPGALEILRTRFIMPAITSQDPVREENWETELNISKSGGLGPKTCLEIVSSLCVCLTEGGGGWLWSCQRSARHEEFSSLSLQVSGLD